MTCWLSSAVPSELPEVRDSHPQLCRHSCDITVQPLHLEVAEEATRCLRNPHVGQGPWCCELTPLERVPSNLSARLLPDKHSNSNPHR